MQYQQIFRHFAIYVTPPWINDFFLDVTRLSAFSRTQRDLRHLRTWLRENFNRIDLNYSTQCDGTEISRRQRRRREFTSQFSVSEETGTQA